MVTHGGLSEHDYSLRWQEQQDNLFTTFEKHTLNRRGVDVVEQLRCSSCGYGGHGGYNPARDGMRIQVANCVSK